MTDYDSTTAERMPLANELERSMMAEFGPVLSGERLAQALGYKTLGAFSQSLCRNTVPVRVFTIPKRKGKFALTRDVAHWLAEQWAQTHTTKKGSRM